MEEDPKIQTPDFFSGYILVSDSVKVVFVLCS